jgi:hypothetical protein
MLTHLQQPKRGVTPLRVKRIVEYRSDSMTGVETVFAAAVCKRVPNNSEQQWLVCTGNRGVVYNRQPGKERASYNGSIEASQASDVGSIPIARSINAENSVDAVGFTGFPS